VARSPGPTERGTVDESIVPPLHASGWCDAQMTFEYLLQALHTMSLGTPRTFGDGVGLKELVELAGSVSGSEGLRTQLGRAQQWLYA
jgi:hypothetical protein